MAEKCFVAQGVRRHVAEESIVPVVPSHSAQQLNTAEQQIVVDSADKTRAFSEFKILLRADKVSGMVLDTGIGLIIFDPARRQ